MPNWKLRILLIVAGVFAFVLLLEIVVSSSVRVGSGQWTAAENCLKHFALAMLNYSEAHGHLPAAAIYGEDGQPLLSWRVAILPYLEEKQLYKRFHLDEPWDSPHNFALIKEMPDVYSDRGTQVKPEPGHTYYQAIVGKGAAFEGPRGLRIPDDFPDGTSKTILLVEGAPAVPWTKPADIPFSPDQPLPQFWTVRKGGGYIVANADSSVMYLDPSAKPPSAPESRATVGRKSKLSDVAVRFVAWAKDSISSSAFNAAP
jgi:hypothetical protein